MYGITQKIFQNALVVIFFYDFFYFVNKTKSQ